MNHPAKVDGIWIYQSSFGWAPVVEVTLDGEVVSSGPVVMDRDAAPEGVVEFAMPWRGVVKLPGAGDQGLDRAIELELWPDSRAFAALLRAASRRRCSSSSIRSSASRSGKACSPTSRDEPPRHDDARGGLERHRGRRAHRRPRRRRGLPEGGTGSGSTISFPELRQYSVFQVSRDAGVPLVLAAAILILVGLLPALYSSRRKVWVRADPDGDGAVLRVGGLAMQRKPQFEEEFARLVDALASAAGGPSRRPARPAGTGDDPGAQEPGAQERVPTP